MPKPERVLVGEQGQLGTHEFAADEAGQARAQVRVSAVGREELGYGACG